MKAIALFDSLAKADLPAGPLYLAIGMFDGVHRGHRSVIEAAVQAARKNDGVAGVLTFWPHPSALFRPEQATRLMMTPAMKHRVLGELGVDVVIEQNFTREFAATDAADFVPLLRRHLPILSGIYVGENFRFGRGRLGDVARLTSEAQKMGVAVFTASRLSVDGQAVSSSRIRELLAQGDIAAANSLLGYAYFAEGVVEAGRQLGRTIGFPTLNLPWQAELAPRYGVYAVEVEDEPGQKYPGVANFGARPTVERSPASPRLEIHLLKPANLDYGAKLKVAWLHFIRAEVKFGGLAELQQQIGRDVKTAREYFQI